jgi:TonB family protein
MRRHIVLYSIGLLFLFLSTHCTLTITDTEQLPDNDGVYNFIAVEKEPYIDLKVLQKIAEGIYPEEAKKRGIEGKVNVRVLVSKSGYPIKYIVESTDSDVLTPAAVTVVMSVKYEPAIQKGKPIDCWVSIPVVFRL